VGVRIVGEWHHAPMDLTALSNAEVFQLYPALIAELKRRELVRREDNPVGDYAEYLVARALGAKLATNKSNARFDLLGLDGKTTYQVKSRRLTVTNPSRELGTVGELESGCFDYLAGVLFNPDFTVYRACLIPFDVVTRLAVRRPKKTIVFLKDSVWLESGVTCITDAVRAAA
jgi:hypothetical protein